MNGSFPLRCACFPVTGSRVLTGFLCVLCVCVVITSCGAPQVKRTPATGIYHVVKKGETAYSIARAYTIPLHDLAEINHLDDVSMIKEGSVLFIPDANDVIDDVMVASRREGDREARPGGGRERIVLGGSVQVPSGGKKTVRTEPPPETVIKPVPAEPKKVVEPRVDEKPVDGQGRAASQGRKPFLWPVQGTVNTRFGIQPDKTYHNWIRIICPDDAQVAAAAAGTVIFSAFLKDYGETIILRHTGDLATVYTHLGGRKVNMDQSVKKGQVIARAGSTTEAGQVYIHFEVRLKGKARNPLFYLP